MPTPRLEEFDRRFLAGQDSMSDPTTLGEDSFARSMNMVNRGGILQCRPGYRCKFATAPGNFQGAGVFRPKQGYPVMLYVVEGILYSSTFPFTEASAVSGVGFAAHARQVFFQQCEQSIQYNDDGSLTLISPRALMVIQDGALTAPVVYDGTTAEHVRGAGEIPLGGPMAWSGDRLWVARGSNLFASDIANPRSFREPEYFATVQAFTFLGDITALAEVPNSEIAQLLVFTENSTGLLQSGIRNRALWNSTANFQRTLFPNVGCVSSRSVTAHLGLLWWYSAFGLTSLNAASLTQQTSVLPYRDNEMADSKTRLSSDLSGIAMGFFENYLLVSVPYCDRFNRHTWVLDNAPLQTSQGVSPTAWNGVWTGTRPVQWLYGNFAGSEQIFYFSRDFDGTNRLWEAFSPDRMDDGCPIVWWMESRGLTGDAPLHQKEFRYADVFLKELDGEIDVAVYWAGASRGRYKQILTKHIKATRGSIRSGETITKDTLLFALKKQSRVIRTQDARELASQTQLSSTDVESPNTEFIDEAFQVLIVGSGPAAVQGIRYYMEPPQGLGSSVGPGKELSGAVEANESEENFVRFDGAAAEASTFALALSEFTADIPLFVSNRTATVTQGELTAVMNGYAESVVSQQDADKIALAVATKKAVNELQVNLPKIVSIGLVLA